MVRRTATLAVAAAVLAVHAGIAGARRLDLPVVSQPPDVAVQATTPCGQSSCGWVAFPLTVSGGYPPYTLLCGFDPPGFLTVGVHPDSCFAQDSKGDTSPPVSFTITVTPAAVDMTPPFIQGVSPGINATATSSAGAAVTFPQPTATDDVDGPVPVTCDHDSGAVFPIGLTKVTCTAKDSHGNTATASFYIAVISWSSTPGGSSSGSASPGSSPASSEPSTPPPGSPSSSGGGGSSASSGSGSAYVPDGTGCTESTCMANWLSGVTLEGCPSDWGSFYWNKTSYTLQDDFAPGSITPTVAVQAGNQTNDVSVSFAANGAPVGVASSAPSGQQSGVDVTSEAIVLRPGTNVITATAVDPLHRLAPMVYTFTFPYKPPTPTATGSNDSAAASGSSPPGAASPAQVASSPPAAISVSKPEVSTVTGRETILDVSVTLPAAALVRVLFVAQAGRPVLALARKAKKGRTMFRPRVPTSLLRHHRTLTVEVVVVRHGKAHAAMFRVRA